MEMLEKRGKVGLYGEMEFWMDFLIRYGEM